MVTNYMLQVRARDGVPEIIASKDLPDGLFTIHGSRSEAVDPKVGTFHRIQVEQRDTEGRYVTAAQHEGPEVR